MQEALTAATYIVVWLICEWVFEIKNGLVKLIVSLSIAIGVYTYIAIKDYKSKKNYKDK